MSRILIVEDEDLERAHLRRSFEELGFLPTDLAVAANGRQGLEMFHEFDPDIVISDITMPGLDGLELIEIIKTEKPQTLCYILTSYAYFSYAQRAIQLGVEDFVLKPISKDDIQALLVSAQAIMEKYAFQRQKLHRMNSLEHKIENDCFVAAVYSGDPHQLADNLKLLGLSGNEQGLAACGSLRQEADSLSLLRQAGVTSVGGKVQTQDVLFLFAPGRFEGAALEALRTFCRMESELTFSIIVQGSQCLIEAWQDLDRLVRHQSIGQIDSFGGVIEQDLVFEVARLLLDEVEEGGRRMNQVIEKARDLLGVISPGQLYEGLVEQLEELLGRRFGERTLLRIHPEASSALEDGILAIGRYVAMVVDGYNRSAALRRYRSATSYIERHCFEQIYLADLAYNLNMSVYSLSKMLNRSSTSNFSDLLHVCRIDAAKQMIRQGESFKYIAWKVGYRSQSYFSKNFKRLTGHSPSAYKEIHDWFLAPESYSHR